MKRKKIIVVRCVVIVVGGIVSSLTITFSLHRGRARAHTSADPKNWTEFNDLKVNAKAIHVDADPVM